MSISRSVFGTLSTGETVPLYTITNSSGAFVKISALGCVIVSLGIPDRSGKLSDVVLGYDTPEEYRRKPKFIGVTVGRFANRIAKGRFSLDNQDFQLECNNNGNALHGGSNGFDKQLWNVVETSDDRVSLEHISPDGTAGYPGTLRVRLSYIFDESNALHLHYEAQCDRPTVCNLTHHCYFNLAGHQTGNLAHQTIQVLSDGILEVDDTLIPTGRILLVAGTPLDLNEPVPFAQLHGLIGTNPLLTTGKGLDFNYVLHGSGLRKIAQACDPDSGRVMDVLSDLPGVQVYSGGNLNDEVFGKGGTAYPQHAAFCLETQLFPDAPNHPEFPSTVLRPGERYDHTTIYRFTIG
jgi:Galactose mutarotase and related enzymes